jgi:biopolymer transport protein ExbD
MLLVGALLATNSFQAMRGLDFGLPRDQRPLGFERASSVVITLRAGGTLELDGRPIVAAELLDALRPRLASNAATLVVLRPEPEATYGEMVSIYDLLRRAGGAGVPVSNLAVSTRRDRDPFWY